MPRWVGSSSWNHGGTRNPRPMLVSVCFGAAVVASAKFYPNSQDQALIIGGGELDRRHLQPKGGASQRRYFILCFGRVSKGTILGLATVGICDRGVHRDEKEVCLRGKPVVSSGSHRTSPP